MPLEIIPAIDLRGGQAVRLQRGDFNAETKVADDPIAVARAFADAGAPRLHVVDLDGAKTGSGENGDVIQAIINAVAIPVQVGGGLRTLAVVAAMLNRGAARVIVGTSAATDNDFAAQLLAEFGDRIIIGADTKDGQIAVRGWAETSGEAAHDFGKRLAGLGAARFLLTDVARDGMLHGVNVQATRDFAQAVGRPTLASGGVRDIHDIHSLVQAQPFGVEGVIIGKALYAGTLVLTDALLVAKGSGE